MNTTPDCQSTILALPWLLNGTLAKDERRQVREHLIACPSCREELARTREMLAMVHGAAEVKVASQPLTRFTTGRRPAVLRQVAWAAALVAVLASTAGIWRASHSRSTVAAGTAAAVRPAPSAASAPAHDVVSVM